MEDKRSFLMIIPVGWYPLSPVPIACQFGRTRTRWLWQAAYKWPIMVSIEEFAEGSLLIQHKGSNKCLTEGQQSDVGLLVSFLLQMGNRNRNFCNSQKENFTQPNQHSLLEAGHATKNPENVGSSESDLSTRTSPQYLVPTGKHNPLWQEYHKAPKIKVQQKQYHHLPSLNPYGLQWQTSLLSSFKYKLPKWITFHLQHYTTALEPYLYRNSDLAKRPSCMCLKCNTLPQEFLLSRSIGPSFEAH